MFLALLAPVQAQGPKEINWTHAFDLAARKLGESEFKKDTQKFGVEAFGDTNNSLGVYISQTGSLALAPNFAKLGPKDKSKGPDWLTGLDVPARKAGEKEFTPSTKLHAMEIFKDPNTDNWLYITEKGLLASCPVTVKTVSKDKRPKFVHSVDLNVRKGGVKDWSGSTKYGVEVYYDGNTGNLLYICETGAIAVVPSDGAPEAAKGKEVLWMHGLDLACRKFNEKDFTKDTKRFGVEVFRDETNNNVILLTEAGNIAVVKGVAPAKTPTPSVKQPVWKHGLNLKARVFGEAEFSDKTRVWGGEVFRDENTGATIYICENGSITALIK